MKRFISILISASMLLGYAVFVKAAPSSFLGSDDFGSFEVGTDYVEHGSMKEGTTTGAAIIGNDGNGNYLSINSQGVAGDTGFAFSDLNVTGKISIVFDYYFEGDGTFNPNGFVTREQFVKMLILSFGGDVLNLKTKFADIDPTQWYAVYVNTANEKGIVNGVSDTKFGVGSPITRQDLVTMLSRACETYGVTLTQNANVSFTDSYTIADYAYNAVMQMAGAGIVNGVSDGIFAPGEYATRAQVAVILDRLNSYQ